MGKSRKDPPSTLEFWIGTALTLLGLAATIFTTHYKLSATQAEARQNHAAEGMQHLCDAANKVEQSLTAEGAMYVAMGQCLQNGTAPNDCWRADYDLDTDVATSAWRELDSTLANIDIYLRTQDETALAAKLRQIPKNHRVAMKPLLGPSTPAAADQALREVIKARDDIVATVEQLRALVTTNRRL